MTGASDEATFQTQVVKTAKKLGWSHLHIRRTRGSRGEWTTSTNLPGWPDLFLWHPTHGVIAAELKSATGKIRPEQETVLESLAAAGVDTRVWRPGDWDEITATLTGQAAA